MRRLILLAFVVLSFPLPPATAAAKEAGFQPLFDGKSLEAFTQKGGMPRFHLEKGEIMGTGVPNTENSVLCTNKEYGDFMLKLEFKVDPQLNSGVQIRSHAYDQPREVETKKGKKRTFPAGRVHGYQVEIDLSPRSYTGAIYDRLAAPSSWRTFRTTSRPAKHLSKANGTSSVPSAVAIRSRPRSTMFQPSISRTTGRQGLYPQVRGVGPGEGPLEVPSRNLMIKELNSK